jgi:hypothetical protein
MPLWLSAAALLLLSACGTRVTSGTDSDALRCTGQVRELPAATLGLPNGGVRVTSASWVPESAQRVVGGSRTQGALPAHCRLVGYIDPVDPQAPKINFQLNLPQRWNHRALQLGGSGFNGLPQDGLGPAPLAPPDLPLPLARGYATFGTDGGHQRAVGVPEQAFAANDEALENFAFAAYKKTRDAAVALIQAHYGSRPERIYHVGAGEGGREGLALAQRFPSDYSGVYAAAPLIGMTGLQLANTRLGILHRGTGWINAAKLGVLSRAVLKACDELDGLKDGVVSRYMACEPLFDLDSLRCRGGADTGDTCLSDPQLAAARAVQQPLTFNFSLAQGWVAYPGFGLGSEDQPWQWSQLITGMAADRTHDGENGLKAAGFVRHFVVRDPAFDVTTLRPDLYRARLQRLSSLLDANDPDLGPFHAWGGKLILHEFSNDYEQSPKAGYAYFEAVKRRLSAPVVDRFVRLYVTPGVNHSGYAPDTPSSIDVLSLLEHWAERNTPPADSLVQTLQSPVPPFGVRAARPLCRYPSFARYSGKGEPRHAASFVCTPQ